MLGYDYKIFDQQRPGIFLVSYTFDCYFIRNTRSCCASRYLGTGAPAGYAYGLAHDLSTQSQQPHRLLILVHTVLPLEHNHSVGFRCSICKHQQQRMTKHRFWPRRKYDSLRGNQFLEHTSTGSCWQLDTNTSPRRYGATATHDDRSYRGM